MKINNDEETLLNGSEPLFSVVLPTFNRAYMCARAIKSIVDQTEESWELHVIDDGSEDITHQLVKSFNDPRIKYIWQENSGVCVARNNGIKRSSGKFICFLDSDDEYLPNHLSVLKQEIESRDIAEGLYFTLGYIEQNGKTTLLDHTSTKYTPILLGDNPDINGIAISNTVFNNGFYYFDEKLKCHEDAELWGRIARRYPVYKISEPTFITHLHSGERKTSQDLIHFLDMEEVYKYIEETQIIRSRIPESALKEKKKQIYVGILKSGWRKSTPFLYYYWRKAMAEVGFRMCFNMQVNKAIAKHLMQKLNIRSYSA